MMNPEQFGKMQEQIKTLQKQVSRMENLIIGVLTFLALIGVYEFVKSGGALPW